MKQNIQLEPAARKVCKANSVPPLIFQLPVAQGRRILEDAQDMPVYKYPAEIRNFVVDTGQWGKICMYAVCPEKLGENVDVIYYIHGAGWVFGSFHTHEKLVRELAFRTNSLVLFPEYSRAPEARYPVAIEQCYAGLCQANALVSQMGMTMCQETLTVAGDSAGGNMAAALTLMAKYRKGPCIQKQLLYYPVTNACFCTGSYCRFAEGYYLYREGMKWFWNQYAPCESIRRQITASPLRASVEQLQGLPEAMILNGEADVLRDEGEVYGEKLRAAGVPVTAVRFGGMIHDFVMLNALDDTKACRAAMDVSTAWICRKNAEKNRSLSEE